LFQDIGKGLFGFIHRQYKGESLFIKIYFGKLTDQSLAEIGGQDAGAVGYVINVF
jgi:hypothetical protein